MNSLDYGDYRFIWPVYQIRKIDQTLICAFVMMKKNTRMCKLLKPKGIGEDGTCILLTNMKNGNKSISIRITDISVRIGYSSWSTEIESCHIDEVLEILTKSVEEFHYVVYGDANVLQ